MPLSVQGIGRDQGLVISTSSRSGLTCLISLVFWSDLGLVAAADPVRDLVTVGLQQLDAADQAVWEVN